MTRARSVVERFRSALAGRADPGFRAGVMNFFREPVDPWGVRSPDVKQVARMAYAAVNPEEFRLFGRWIGRYVPNWANCRGVAGWLLAAIENSPALIGELLRWTASTNRWTSGFSSSRTP